MIKIIKGYMEPVVDVSESINYRSAKPEKTDIHIWARSILDTEARVTVTIKVDDATLTDDQVKIMLTEGWSYEK